MRILILHSMYRSGALSGENRVVEEEAELLRGGGHDVDTLAPHPDSMSRRSLAARSLASHGLVALLRERVRSEKIEIVHCHNLFPTLGPGVLAAASQGGAAVVMTLHNYRMMCIAGTFFRNGRVCQTCLGRTPIRGVVHACYRGSRPESAVLAASLVAARTRNAFASVHRFLAVSEFVRDKHIEAGIAPDRIQVKPNVVSAHPRRAGAGTYFLVLSRLSVEKGVSQIVEAWDRDIGELVIAGDGPERGRIERLAAGRGISLRGSVSPMDVPALVAGSRAVLVPSSCFEGQGRVILEAYAAGVPVIASRIGGIPEFVDEGKTGLTVPPDDRSAWRAAARSLASDSLSIRLGEGAFECWQDRFSPARGLADLEAAYLDALHERTRSCE